MFMRERSALRAAARICKQLTEGFPFYRASLAGGAAQGGTWPFNTSSARHLPRWAVFASGLAFGTALSRHDTETWDVLLDAVRPLKVFAHPSSRAAGAGLVAQSTPTTMPLAGCLGPFFIADAAAKAAPAVVNVLVQQDGTSPVASSGSGFIMSTDGIVVTNAHVVADAIASVQPKPVIVTLGDGRPFEARLLAWDAISDLAVLSIDQGNGQLPSCRLGSSASLRAGEWVIAMGSPLGMSNTLTAGIISCVDRKAVELGLAGVGAGEYIQTDASINRGSSGGPLVNLAGEVVGVSCMKAVAADGVSFHIPIDAAREVVAQLLDRGRVIRPFIGVKLLQLNALNLAQIRRRDSTFPEDVKDGVLVPHIKPGSPAEKAGLQQGDVIVSYEGVSSGEKATTAGLIRALSEHVGKPLELRVMRPRSSEEKESAQGGGRRGCALVTIRVVAEEASQQQQQQHLLQQQHGFQSRPV